MDNNYKIGDIFTFDEEYSARADFVNENRLLIREIGMDENGERLFQIQEVPQPTEQELTQEKIKDLKSLLEKYKEDVEQVDLFGMVREDYEEKKQRCATIIIELRGLEQQESDGKSEN